MLVPVWLISLALQPFMAKTHPWKDQHLTLQSWNDTATDFTVDLSSGIWILTLCIIYATWIITHARAAH